MDVNISYSSFAVTNSSIRPLVCRKQTSIDIDPSLMKENDRFFQVFWLRSVGRRGQPLAPCRPRIHMITSRPIFLHLLALPEARSTVCWFYGVDIEGPSSYELVYSQHFDNFFTKRIKKNTRLPAAESNKCKVANTSPVLPHIGGTRT